MGTRIHGSSTGLDREVQRNPERRTVRLQSLNGNPKSCRGLSSITLNDRRSSVRAVAIWTIRRRRSAKRTHIDRPLISRPIPHAILQTRKRSLDGSAYKKAMKKHGGTKIDRRSVREALKGPHG